MRKRRLVGATRATCWHMSASRGVFVPPGVVAFPRPVLLFHHQHGSSDVLGLPPASVRALRRRPGHDRLRPHQDRHPAPRRPGWRCRWIRKRPRSPTITASPSTSSPPTGRPGKVGSNDRSTSSGHVIAGSSCDSIRELDGAFDALASDLPIQGASHPTARSSPSGRRLTGPRSGVCRTSRCPARCHREFARSLSWVQWTRTACGFLNKHGAG